MLTNPFYNYQTDSDLYIIQDKYIVPASQAVNIKNGEILTRKNNKWVDKRGRIIPDGNIIVAESGTLWAKYNVQIGSKKHFTHDEAIKIAKSKAIS